MPQDKKWSHHLVVKCCYYGFILFGVLFCLYCIKLLFGPLLASILLVLIFNPIVNYFEARGFKRLHIILGIYGVIVLTAAALVIFVFPRIITEAQIFAQDLPKYKLILKTFINDLQKVLQQKLPQIQIPDLVLVIKSRLPGGHGIAVDKVVAYVSSFFAIISVVVIVPFITFFLLVDGHLIVRAGLKLVPNTYFEMAVLLIHKVIVALKNFIQGQMIDAAAVGIMTIIGLGIIGLPYFFVIGIIAGIGALIPYLGPIIGFVPALIVSMITDGGITLVPFLKILSVSVVVQFIEGNFVYPIAVGKTSNLHPLTIIIGVTIGSQIGGVLGMILSVPLISIVKVSFEVMHSYLKSYSII